jgi:hypothetical protein
LRNKKRRKGEGREKEGRGKGEGREKEERREKGETRVDC